METLWFILVAFMLGMYVLLDGFDLGAGAIHPFAARTDQERRAILLLRLDHGLAYEEIAAALGLSLAKVKVEIHRGRQILRDELEGYEGGRS